MPTDPTPADRARDLEADLALCDGASPAPWCYAAASVFDAGGGAVAHVYQGDPELEGVREQAQRDGRFLAAAREGWPAAIRRAAAAEAYWEELFEEGARAAQECLRLGAENARLRDLLRSASAVLWDAVAAGERRYGEADMESSPWCDLAASAVVIDAALERKE